MGERPAGKTLDRIDINGDYEPGNCQWSTLSRQQRTRAVSIGDEAADRIRWYCLEGYTQADIARSYGVHPSMVSLLVNGKTYKEVGYQVAST